MIDLDELKRSAELARDSYHELRTGQLSPGAFDSRWSAFHRAANPAVILELIRMVREK